MCHRGRHRRAFAIAVHPRMASISTAPAQCAGSRRHPVVAKAITASVPMVVARIECGRLTAPDPARWYARAALFLPFVAPDELRLPENSRGGVSECPSNTTLLGPPPKCPGRPGGPPSTLRETVNHDCHKAGHSKARAITRASHSSMRGTIQRGGQNSN